MKTKVKTVSKKELKKIAEQLAGPAINWITFEERNMYIKGVMDGILFLQQTG